MYTTNYDQLYAYLSQHEAHANEVRIERDRYPNPFALVANSQTQSHSAIASPRLDPRYALIADGISDLSGASMLIGGVEIGVVVYSSTGDMLETKEGGIRVVAGVIEGITVIGERIEGS
ncbi:hypothetical protein Tco_1049547 [Tanacetum coccineum]